MAISNLVTLDTSTPGTKAGTAAEAHILYTAISDIPIGVYNITCIDTTITKVEFYNGTSLVTSQETLSGIVSFNLGTACTSIRFWTNTGTDVVVSLVYVASPLSTSTFSGTLDIVTTTSTYNETGQGYAVLIGGGGGGSAAFATDGGGGGGGSGGVLSTGLIDLIGSMPIVIGTGGDGANTSGGVGNAGNATTFAGFTANGGGAGNASTGGNNQAGGGGAAGTPGGGAGGNGQLGNSAGGQNGFASTIPNYSFVVSGTTGGGGGGTVNGAYSGGGSGIGTGGAGAHNNNQPATSPNGYGSGGGGGGGSPSLVASTGGNPGAVYIFRF
jgi:hypothetical protein